MRFKIPDKKNAQSLVEAAEKEMKFTLSLPISKESGSTILRNVYECFRMAGDALLVHRGVQSSNHKEPIQEITSLNVKTSRPLRVLENLMAKRHNINYEGYIPSLEEVKDSIDFAKSCFSPVIKQVKEIVKN